MHTTALLALMILGAGQQPVTLEVVSGSSASATPPEVERLLQELETLDQKVRILQRKLEIEKEQEIERATTQPRVTAGRDGFILRSGDGSHSLRFRGYVHSDGRFFADGADVPDTFILRRVRPVLEATMFGAFDFKVMPDFGEGRTVLQDAFVDARFKPLLKIRGGKFKAPFGLERLASATELLFLERGAPTLLAPNRDLGFMVFGDTTGGRLSYQAAVMNGVTDGGSADLDDRAGKDVILRVFAHPFKGSARKAFSGLGAGFAASVGSDTGTRTIPGLPTFRTSGGLTFFRYRGDGTASATAIAAGDRFRTSVQGYWYLGRLGFLTEHIISRQDVALAAATEQIDNTAWVAAGSFVLTGEETSYRAVQPRREFSLAKNTWGAVELTGRVTRLSVDDAAFPVFADAAVSARSATEWAAGVNWYLNRAVKYVVGYHETRFDGGAAAGGTRPTERDILVRMQFVF
jgi:phosphate-selective porin OprO/OprP